MSVPFRLRAQKALCALLETITVEIPSYDSGSPQNLTGRVFRGRAGFGPNDPDLMLSVLEDPRSQDRKEANNASPGSRVAWWLIIQGFVPDDSENPTDPAHYLAAAVIEKLATIKKHPHSLPGGILQLGTSKPMVEAISIGSPVVRPPDEISSKAYFWMDVTLTLVEDHENQFT